MRSDSRNLIASLALLSLYFVFPDYQPVESDTGNTLVILLLGAAGILLSRIFVVSSKSGDRSGIEPSILAFIASWQCSTAIFPVVAFFAFTGSIINAIRAERPVAGSISPAVFQGVSFAVFLRLGAFLYGRAGLLGLGNGAVAAFASLSLTAMILTLLRTVSVNYTGERSASFLQSLRRNMVSNWFILLLAVPGTLAVENSPNSIEMLTTVTLSLFAMVAVHGISISLNRSFHERTGELETVSRLKELPEKLSTAGTEAEVIRVLAHSLSEAWRCPSMVKWKNIRYAEGANWESGRGVSFTHRDGLTVSVDSFNSTVSEYLETFADRTVPVLTGLEAEKRMEKASWKSVETMISFLEGNESDFAGFSRRTAATAEELAGALGKNGWFRDCVRLAGLLHTLQFPEEGSSGSADQTLALPEITDTALTFMNEHWCGTGPGEKKGAEIPLAARILAVSAGWEKAIRSGREVAARDLNMKAGTLFDPELVRALLEIRG